MLHLLQVTLPSRLGAREAEASMPVSLPGEVSASPWSGVACGTASDLSCTSPRLVSCDIAQERMRKSAWNASAWFSHQRLRTRRWSCDAFSSSTRMIWAFSYVKGHDARQLLGPLGGHPRGSPVLDHLSGKWLQLVLASVLGTPLLHSSAPQSHQTEGQKGASAWI